MLSGGSSGTKRWLDYLCFDYTVMMHIRECWLANWLADYPAGSTAAFAVLSILIKCKELRDCITWDALSHRPLTSACNGPTYSDTLTDVYSRKRISHRGEIARHSAFFKEIRYTRLSYSCQIVSLQMYTFNLFEFMSLFHWHNAQQRDGWTYRLLLHNRAL